MPLMMEQPKGGEGGSGKFIKEDIPSGLYPATLVELESGETPSFDDKTKMVPCVYWTFEIHGKKSSVKLIAQTSSSFNSGLTFGKKSKAFDWAEKLLGDLPPDPFDLEQLLSRPCQVMVERKTSKKDGSNYAVITNVLPVASEDVPF